MSSSACPCSSLLCAPWQKTRPNSSGAHSPRFVFRFFFISLCFGSCVSVPRQGSRRSYPAIAHCKRAWEFGGIAASAASPLAASPHARRSREISAAGGGSPKPASDSMPAGPPLTQCPRRWTRGCLTHARRIGADSCPLAAANPSPVDRVHTSRPGVLFLSRVVSTGAVLISHVLSGPRRLSGAGGSSCCGRRGHSSHLPPCCGSGGRSWGNLVRAPDVLSCPEEASASELAQEGFLFLWVVMSCPVCSALEGYHVLFVCV